MRLYLAQSLPNGWGGVSRTVESMKLYLADSDVVNLSYGTGGGRVKLRILLSYHYYKDVDLDALFSKYFADDLPDVFADSGGYSAMTQGVDIDWRDYAAWVKRWGYLFTTYANLDVIGDAEATLDNQKRLRDAGLNPLPVFHVGEDWAYLERYIEQYPYIALGGMVPHMRFAKRIIPWIIKAFKLAGDRSVYHGFGATAWKVIRDLPWYSVDSSSWGQGFRFGTVPLFSEKRGRFVKCQLGDAKSCHKHGSLIRSLGFDPGDFADRTRNDRAKICAISALSYMLAEKWLQDRHGEVRIPGSGMGAPLVPKVHLVTASHPASNHSVDTLVNSLNKSGGGRAEIISS